MTFSGSSPLSTGPKSSSLGPSLRSELDRMSSLTHPVWCLGGDFNVTRWSFGRNTSSLFTQEMRDFSDFISRNELLDIPLQGSKFTWSNHSSNPTLSKLDRFLTSVDWDEKIPKTTSLTLPKPTSDHCPILLDTNAIPKGPCPFRFELHWLQDSNLFPLVQSWWTSFASQGSGRAGFKLQTKIQLLKSALKSWSKSSPTNFSLIKASLLEILKNLDDVEETRPLDPSEQSLRTKTKLDYLSTIKKRRPTSIKGLESLG
ncbi:hypothetical protein AMTRI_Chr08g165000 [Amborella trichopoda]